MSRWRIPLSDLDFGEAEAEAVAEVVRSGWLTLGERVRTFEAEFAAAHGVDDAVAVANGTAALHLGAIAAGLEPGGEVIVPSLSFVASANAIAVAGGRPVFADIVSLDEPTIDPASVEALLGPKTVGVMAMHYGGHPCRMDELLALCERHGIFLIEDAAHAPGVCTERGHLGTLGRVGCFSFFGNKNLTTGEGGMVLSRDPEVLEKVRLLRSHGMTSMSWERYSGQAWDYDVLSPGFNYRPTEMTGALGSVRLAQLQENNRRRNALLGRYEEGLDPVSGVRLPFQGSRGSGHLAAIVVQDAGRRDPLRTALADDGIQTSLHYPPIHRFRTYRDGAPAGGWDCPRTDDYAARVVTLPLYPSLSEEAVDEVVGRIRDFLDS